jgi:hypothetical protein
MRKILLALSLPMLALPVCGQLFQSSQQSYSLNIPDESIAAPPCQQAAAKSKREKKAAQQAAANGCVVAELKKSTDAAPKVDAAKPETQKSATP